ncbi:DUF6735 family protein [Halobiforma nitratireducens]|uniref:Uncharacterized protein n=1 Tax=Halobiforma nitratireducens JCM 10879 TaxID=1227454 RepID=M0MDV9_9EURY|nr:DUF6735 family protein [Halobiforma nitratireducens]EMA43493.1 hypothetical protein C446_03269 [Halobiforma nitratireducens JCM 10879]
MGHRALVAYRRPDRLYDLRYSHWGGDDLSLGDDIRDRTPLADGAVDAGLLADSIARERILTDFLDPCIYEALYLVDPGRSYAVESYRVCWLEWGDGRESGRGAIIGADGADDPHVRIWFRATKTTLADAIEMGALSRRAAQAYLEARVCEDRNGTVYTYVDGSPRDRESNREPGGVGTDPVGTTRDGWLGGQNDDSESGSGGGTDRDPSPDFGFGPFVPDGSENEDDGEGRDERDGGDGTN